MYLELDGWEKKSRFPQPSLLRKALFLQISALPTVRFKDVIRASGAGITG
jgi:hypothetical protein